MTRERSRLRDQIVSARNFSDSSSAHDPDLAAHTLPDLNAAAIRAQTRSQIQTQMSLVADATVCSLHIASILVPDAVCCQILLHAITHLPRCLRESRGTVHRIDEDLLPALQNYDRLQSDLSGLLQVRSVDLAPTRDYVCSLLYNHLVFLYQSVQALRTSLEEFLVPSSDT